MEHYYGIVWDKYYYLFIQDASKLIDGDVCENLKYMSAFDVNC